MAVQFDGGVVIGADTRTTTGAYIVSALIPRYNVSHTPCMVFSVVNGFSWPRIHWRFDIPPLGEPSPTLPVSPIP